MPSAGVIEGVHFVGIRLSRGELNELNLNVPKGSTIIDVLDGNARRDGRNAQSLVSLWRFDPDTRKLRVTLSQPQSGPFSIVVRSQVPTGPLPFEQSVGLISVENAASQIGLLGLATGNEVQLDTVRAESFAPLELEDFPGNLASAVPAPGLMVRRAFRYSDSRAVAVLKVSTECRFHDRESSRFAISVTPKRARQ